MNQIEALQRLRSLATPVVETRDVAALLQVEAGNATAILRRLARKRMIVHLRRGRWLVTEPIDRLALPELLIAPYPAYVSLQSALFHHGMIEQIPAVTYAVTPARTQRLQTPLGTISFHRMPAELFTGFELAAGSDAKIATPEKALFDLFYLAPGRSRLFSRQPELAIPKRFRWRLLGQYTKMVKSAGRRAFIAERIRSHSRLDVAGKFGYRPAP
jgi:predicted transcriptional regulator of viral defense system